MVYKLKDAIYGLAVGDALGVPFEFEERNSFECTDMIGYGTHDQPEGTWSDDTSMTLATCMSIKNKGYVNLTDIRNQFEKWLFNNEYTPFNEVFDCGNTCYCAIKDKCGQTDEWSNGNGSLMRIIPLAFIKEISDKTIEDISAITHAHNISKDICVKYIHIAKDLLIGMNLKDAIKEETSNEFFDELLECNEENIISSSFVVDSFKASLWCLLKTDNYKDCVLKAVNLGCDTDTTAAIAGGIAGIMYGYDSIPKDWIEKLQRKDLIEECLF